MTNLSRRAFGQAMTAAGVAGWTGLAAPALAAPAIVAPSSGGRIVIIGGGPGGATVAVQLKRADPNLQVTLVDSRLVHPTCFYSNLYLGGFRTFASLVQTFDGLRALGITVLNETANEIDVEKKLVKFGKGRPLAYDRLVLSPGIALKYETIEGYSEAAAELMPHAWRAGPQTQLLKRQLAAMPNGGTVVLTAPALPYRCPPAPYERACMIAHYLKSKKPRSKIILLDAKRSFTKQAAFEEAFTTLYKGQIELALSNEIDDNTVVRVNPETREVFTKSGRRIVADVANIVPAQRSGDIAKAAGTTEGDWCPVTLDNFRSTKVRDVYVLGDAAMAAEMPKSAFSANSQAKVVAADILADVSGKERFAPRFRNTCWSMLGPDNSVKIGANYTPGLKDGKPAMVANGAFVSGAGETAEVRKANYSESSAWYDAITTDAFARDAKATEGAAPEPEAAPRRKKRRA
jgi:NADPH-dependent 2,4-dienoyl-CoA reductase/sulfur reductase-like enzyme